ncbi:aminotransferase class-III [Dethiosulfovibrio peptidovorans DSM 11002]|uniref:Aminotransferase class-III n=1 Tax=Dethiosulfovibrio peptidovorans DSM 11002 TaxID=469381 RepID=D2Z857_9BACT|nr:aminotransferase class III-fold pyridoxal phosphate-dependent enzyme [Dethiosulfovibrio peptidovorans]EFC91654.1 aminotransferase class-III [Dethiosulfovibrio peptidovorans DSM 11002]
MSGLYGGRGLKMASGKGAELVDDGGKRYIDFMAGHGSSLFGHCHPELISAVETASRSPWSIGLGIDSHSRDGFLSVLRSLLPDGKAFMCNSGTEAVEAALKLVLARSDRSRILALKMGFHGRTLGALGLTFNPKYRKPWMSSLIPVEHLSSEELLDSVDQNTAAVFVEPVQGEGGVYPMDPDYGRALSDRCRENGAMLVADEIQSGWGRCGSVLASSMVGLDPDILCLAKGLAGGLPVGAMIWKGSIGDFPPGGHGTTYGGNPFISAVGLAAWNLLEERKYPLQAESKGADFMEALKGIDSPQLRGVRGLGLLVGIETARRSTEFVRMLQDRGVLALPAGPKVLRFLPPFVAERSHFDEVVHVLEEVCHELDRR